MTALTDTTRAARPSWPELPGEARATVEAKLGSPVVKAFGQAGGFTPGVASRLVLANGRRVFVKALPGEHPLSGGYRAESALAARLPERAPTSRLLFAVDADWTVLVFDDIDGREPNLRPGSPDTAAVLAALGALARAGTPCPIREMPSVLTDLGPLLRGWCSLRAAPPLDLDDWSARNLDSLVAMESAWLPWADGNTLVHNEIRPDNLIRRTADGQVLVVDWSYPCRGAAWLDTAALVPHLLLAGHSAADAERMILRRPLLSGVPAWAVTGFAAATAGYWELSSRLPEPDGALGLRRFQARAAAATRRWLQHRTRWT